MNVFKNWKNYIICIVLIITGVLSTLSLINWSSRQTQTFGGPMTNEWKTEMAQFSYENTSLDLYLNPNNGKYEFSESLLVVPEYNGIKNKYELELNGFKCLNAEIDAGYARGNFEFEFLNTAGDLIVRTSLTISIEFFSTRTQLKIVCPDGELAASHLISFFYNFGIRIAVNVV